MKKDVDLFVVCKYDRWCSYWFKALLNYIISSQNGVVRAFNSRIKSITIEKDGEPFTIKFLSKTALQNSSDGHVDYSVIAWNDGEVTELYSQINKG